MDHVSSGSTAPLYAIVTINGSPLSVEIDIGASVSTDYRKSEAENLGGGGGGAGGLEPPTF